MSRVLIVDDEPSLVDVLATLLSDEGYQVQTAPNGRVALEKFILPPPDLLITDVMMPELDGWALLTRVRICTPDLPVIVMSAADPAVRDGDRSRMDHTVFLRKPFDIDTLLSCVERLTRTQSR